MKSGIARRAVLRSVGLAAVLGGLGIIARPARARITLKAMSETMTVQSAAFKNGQAVPRRFTCDGENVSPPLSWSDPPSGTQSLAIVCYDPDAPSGTFHHWAVFDLPPDLHSLDENFSAAHAPGAREAVSDFGRPGYRGPCPPKGHGVHHYHFEVFALDVAKLDLPAGVTVPDVRKAAAAHALAHGELVGTYQR